MPLTRQMAQNDTLSVYAPQIYKNRDYFRAVIAKSSKAFNFEPQCFKQAEFNSNIFWLVFFSSSTLIKSDTSENNKHVHQLEEIQVCHVSL